MNMLYEDSYVGMILMPSQTHLIDPFIYPTLVHVSRETIY